MFSGPKDTQRSHCIACRLGPPVVAVIVALCLTLSPGYARACPTEMQSANSTTIAQTQLSAGVARSPELNATHHGFNLRRQVARCSERESHSGTSGCHIGCCPACTAAVGVGLSGLHAPDELTDYKLTAEGRIPSITAPGQFRPPRPGA